jgi:uncharacterized membrane protein YccC
MNPLHFKRLHNLIWTLIYGGLLCVVVSLFVARTDETLACWMALCGAVVAGAGVVLIFVRSKYKDI